MTISKHKVVSLNYVLTNDNGDVLDKADDGSFQYLHGANNIIPGLENALDKKTSGDQFKVTISPEEAYGPHSEELIQTVSIDMFQSKDQVQVGQQFEASDESGHPILITVTAVDGDNVTIDGNHPLAGQTLHFDVTVTDIRDATSEEIEHGHAHGPDGHHH